MYLLKKQVLTDVEIEGFFKQMILAVLYVHKQGLIHRDIKPSNFMVTKNGQIILLDFGIAKNTNLRAVDYSKTGLGEQIGTPLYMSPEQVRSTSEITKETDYYSLGVVLWQLVKNKSPYDIAGISLPEIQVSILKEPLPLTHTIWDVLIQNATEKNPSKRNLIIHPKKHDKSYNKKDTETNFSVNNKKQKIKELFSNDVLIKSLVLIGLVFFSYLIFTVFNSKKSIDPIYTTDNQVNTTKDSDNDGFIDKEDSCITIFSKTNFGCPDDPKTPKKDTDTDHDGFIDKEDSCVDVFSKTNSGCPEKTTIEPSHNLKIGQKYQGGIIFYLDNSGKHGKACTEKNLGKFDWNSAMEKCNNLNLNGYADWYLPSNAELKLLYSQKKTMPGLSDSEDTYWSRTEDNENAYYFTFGLGTSYSYKKTKKDNVRGVRAF